MSKTVQTISSVHQAFYSVGTGVFLEEKRPGSEVDQSPPSSVKVKNEWSYSYNSPLCDHDVDREKFTFIY